MKDNAISFASNLIQTPSVSLKEQQAADLVENKMRALGYDDVFRDAAGNVIGIIFGRIGEHTVLLNSHMDTVPPPKPNNGDSAEHSAGDIIDETLYGTGAADCKAGLTSQIYAGALLKKSLLPLRGNLVVAATVAEENGRSTGTRILNSETLPSAGIKPDFAILGEPTGLGLYYGHDGWMEMDIVIDGDNPFQVEDSAQAILDDITEFEHLKAGTQTRESLKIERPRFSTISGRQRATIPVTRRIAPGENALGIVHQFRHNATTASPFSQTIAVDVAVREQPRTLYNGKTTLVRHLTNAWAIDPFHPLFTRARQGLAAAGFLPKPGKWELGQLGMGTAGSILVDEFNIPTIGYGPGDEKLAHTANESVNTSAVIDALYGTAAMVHALIGIPVCGWASEEI